MVLKDQPILLLGGSWDPQIDEKFFRLGIWVPPFISLLAADSFSHLVRLNLNWVYKLNGYMLCLIWLPNECYNVLHLDSSTEKRVFFIHQQAYNIGKYVGVAVWVPRLVRIFPMRERPHWNVRKSSICT